MEDLQSRLNKYLNENLGVQAQIMSTPEMVAFVEDQAKALKAIVDAETSAAPFSVAPSTSISSVVIDGNIAKIEVNYDHEAAKRTPFSDRGPSEADLLFLLNNGWSSSKPAPWGYYKGKYTQAWNSRGGYRFVQAAIQKFNSQCPPFVEASYDPEYDG